MKNAGIGIIEACKTVDIARSTYYYKIKTLIKKERKQKEDDMHLVELIKNIKTDHPFWGYRRIHAWIRNREGILVNQKVIRRLMKKYDLICDGTKMKLRVSQFKKKPKATRPLQFWGIDMTKFMVNSIGWVYLVVVLDWYTKRITGFDISLQSKTADWKRAIDMGINNCFPDGVREKNLKLISDNGSQPTSIGFMNDMKMLDIKQIFTTYDNPKGNAETERVMRTIKEEVIWINDFDSLNEAKTMISKWIEEDYNKLYVHSALGYLSPEEFEKAYYEIEAKIA